MPSAFDQDRRMPRGLRLLPAERALRDGRRPRGTDDPGDVLAAAKRAKAEGATRFCMGAAWRQVRDGKDFERVLEMVRGVAELGHGSVLHAGNAHRIAGRSG